jgi:uncharacterized protein (DUF1015 family)
LILPTHRLIGALEGFDLRKFQALLGRDFLIQPSDLPPEQIDRLPEALASAPPHTFGLYDGTAGKLYTLHLKNPDILRSLEPKQSDAWQVLDVAILQRYLVEEVLQKGFAPGTELARGYTADARTIPQQVDGKNFQIALLLRPTPLHALEELGRHGEVMPQKSTYFFPKLATGMVINPLE